MQDRLEKLFNEIGISDDMLTYFRDASIEKVVIYDKNKLLDFVINTNKVLPIDIYNGLLDKLIGYFKEIKNINLFINPSDVDNSLLMDYYTDIMKSICLDKNKYNIFLEREIKTLDIKTLIYIELITSNKKYSKRRKIIYIKITWIKWKQKKRERIL